MANTAFNKTGVHLSEDDIIFICRALKENNLKLLCLRECKVGKKDFQRILKLVSSCHSIQQLTLNVGMVTTVQHVELLAQCIHKNKSLTGLHIHGSELGDIGMQILGRALSLHPGVVSLDVGDCKLGDLSIDVIYSLMLPFNNRPGITELTLSDNPRISALGWAQFAMCLANCNSLRWLFLDYNRLGDYGASCILIGMAASQSIEILDMEGCGLTEHTGQAILHLVQNHLGSLSRIKLSNNRIRKSTIEAIRKHLSENHLDDSDAASSVTVDEIFSLNESRVKSSKKHSKRSTSSSFSSSSSSLLSSSSSSSDDSDDSSNNDSDAEKKKKKVDKKSDGKKDKDKEDEKKKKTDKERDKIGHTEKKNDSKKKDVKKEKKRNEEKDEKNEGKKLKTKVEEKTSDKDKQEKKDKREDEAMKSNKKEKKNDETDKEKRKTKKDKKDNEEETEVEEDDEKQRKDKKKDKAKKSNKKENKNDETDKEKGKTKKDKKKGNEEETDDEEDDEKPKKEKKKSKAKKQESESKKIEETKKKQKFQHHSDDDEDDDDESSGEELAEVPVFYK